MLYINLPYACFGLIISEDKVVNAPPIAKWCEGKSVAYVTNYYTKKGGKVSWISLDS